MDTSEKYGMPALEDTDDGEGNVSLLRDLSVLKKTNLLQKDFKIKVQIGEVEQKDKISYVSLMHQINKVKSSGYDQEDTINSVIRANDTKSNTRKRFRNQSSFQFEKVDTVSRGAF